MFRVHLANDHGGFLLREVVVEWAKSRDYQLIDHGNSVLDQADNDFEYARLALGGLRQDLESGLKSRAVLICTSGIAMTIQANRSRGLRAVLPINLEHAKTSREHNDCNVLALGGNFHNRKLTKEILDIWFDTDYLGFDRYNFRNKALDD
ncbi:RpiB/LacA/LacB family sugar-phosphate isomerase [Candidatus Saccharibacteria bacterium]|nr:RpiB/LacA/LacB family sugar-phosphate isomerase [Candidatus Saccharibacteria bacterium]